MNHLYRQFQQSVRWNALSGVIYHALLLSHQLALFLWVGRETYGMIGTMFSILYLTITLTNLGLDASLPAFFHGITADKSTAKRFLFIQSLPECVLLVTAALLGGWYGVSRMHLDISLVIVLGLLLIVEGIRKTLRTLLHLAFLNRVLAFIEVGTVLGYIATIWILIILGYSVQLIHIFLPMLIFSMIGLCAKFVFLSRWLSMLPIISSTPPLTYYRIIKNRLCNYATHLGHAVFSSNFLVPLCAVHFGIGSAGIFKIISSIIQALSSLLRTIFGISGAALFAHLRTAALNQKQHAFSMVTHKLHTTLYIFLALVITSLYACSYALPSYISHTQTMGIIAYCTIILSEHFFMMYEAFYITEEKPFHIFAFTTLSLTILGMTLLYAPLHSPSSMLAALLLGRVCLFILISTFSFYTWRLIPAWWYSHTDPSSLETPENVLENSSKVMTD